MIDPHAKKMSDPPGSRIEFVTSKGSLVMYFNDEFTGDEVVSIANAMQRILEQAKLFKMSVRTEVG